MKASLPASARDDRDGEVRTDSTWSRYPIIYEINTWVWSQGKDEEEP